MQNAGFGGLDQRSYALQTMVKPKVHAPQSDIFGQYEWPGKQIWSYDNIFIREFYARSSKDKFVIYDGITGDKQPFDTEEEAIEWGTWLFNFYSQPAVQVLYDLFQEDGVPITPPISRPKFEKCKYVTQSVFAGPSLVHWQEFETDSIPYKAFIPQFYDGDLTSHFEQGKAPQRMWNRLMAAVDERESGPKPGVAINAHYLPPDWDEDKIRDFWVQMNPMLIINKNDQNFDWEKVIHQMPGAPKDAGLYNLMGQMQLTLDNLFGGPNSRGQQAFAGQSGKSAEALMASASNQLIPIWDKNNFFQKEVGLEAIALMKHLDPAVRMSVTDEFDERINSSLQEFGVKNVEDLSYSIHVSTVVASPTKQAEDLGRLTFVMQTMSDEGQEDLIPDVVQNILPPSQYRKYMQRRAAREEGQAKAAQAAQQFEIWERTTKLNNETLRLQNQEREISWKEQNQPKISIGGKPGDYPVGLLSQIMNNAGPGYGEYEPGPVLVDRAVQATFDQDVANVGQRDFNRLTPPWQRKEGSRGPKGTMTPKDKKQRKAR